MAGNNTQDFLKHCNTKSENELSEKRNGKKIIFEPKDDLQRHKDLLRGNINWLIKEKDPKMYEMLLSSDLINSVE